MKQYMLLIMLVCCALAPVATATSVDEFTDAPYNDRNNLPQGEDAANIGQNIQQEAIDDDQSAVQRIMTLFRIDYNNQGEEQTATFFIKNVLNYFLAVIGLVSLVVLVLGFYRMFVSAKNEEGYEQAKTIVVRAALAIIIIGVSWFLVSWFFDVYMRVRDSV